MNFKNALNYPFRGQRRWPNIALLALCNLIPIIGPIVALGYGAISEKQLVRNLDSEPPVFDFGNFSKYLERGVAPFVVQLILTFIFIPIMWVLMFGGMLFVALAHDIPWLAITGISVCALFFILLSLFLPVLMMPFMLRAALLGKIGAAFDFKWCLDFVRRVGFIGLVYLIIAGFIAFGLILAGVLACLVGVYFAAVIVAMFYRHVQIQIYQLYLDRGGIPLNIPDEILAPAFPVLTPQQR